MSNVLLLLLCQTEQRFRSGGAAPARGGGSGVPAGFRGGFQAGGLFVKTKVGRHQRHRPPEKKNSCISLLRCSNVLKCSSAASPSEEGKSEETRRENEVNFFSCLENGWYYSQFFVYNFDV